MRSAWLAVLVFALAAEARAAGAPAFTVEHLGVAGDLGEVEAADLDGDGHLDLVATLTQGQPPHVQRSLAVFWNRGGSFSPKPDLLIPADADLCAFDLADVDGAPGAELLAITPDGVEARSFAGRALGPWRQLVSQPTLFARAVKDELPRFRVVQPLGANGAGELVVPELAGLSVYAREGASFVKKSELAVDIEATLDLSGHDEGDPHQTGVPSFEAGLHFPAISAIDTDADGRMDLVLARKERLAIHRQRADGSFPTKPDLTREFAVRTAQELRDAQASVRITVADVDGDGRADAILTKTVSEGISSASTTIYVYFGGPSGFSEKPDQVLQTNGAGITGVQLADVTGDGRPDLVVPSVKIGLFAIIRMLTSKSIKVQFQLYPFGPGRHFASKPTAERSITFQLDLGGHTDLQAITMYGDVDGDGRLDLVFGTDEEELSIFPGSAKGELFASDASAEIPVRAYGRVLPVDLDARKRSDLVLWYPGTRGHKGELSVVHAPAGAPISSAR